MRLVFIFLLKLNVVFAKCFTEVEVVDNAFDVQGKWSKDNDYTISSTINYNYPLFGSDSSKHNYVVKRLSKHHHCYNHFYESEIESSNRSNSLANQLSDHTQDEFYHIFTDTVKFLSVPPRKNYLNKKSNFLSDSANTSATHRSFSIQKFQKIVSNKTDIERFDTTKKFSYDKNKTIYASKFGFSSSSSALKNTQSLQQINALVNKSGGGYKIIIEPGVYRVGVQKFAGANGLGYAYAAQQIFHFANCSKPILVEGNGATLKLADNLRIGAFHPVTGLAINSGITANINLRADPGFFFRLYKNTDVTIRNLTLDGNIENLKVGGQFGDTGYQCEGDGIYASFNENLQLINVIAKKNGRDGLMVQNNPLAKQQVFLTNCEFLGNGRQGLSWVGGTQFYATKCKFNNTGRTLNKGTGLVFASAPGAGIDIEAEEGLCANGTFEDCEFVNNNGVGVLNPETPGKNNHFIRCLIVGTTSWSIWFNQPYAYFESCKIVGALTHFYRASGYKDLSRTIYANCTITLDSTQSPTGVAYNYPYLFDFEGGVYALFTKCTLDGAKGSLAYTADVQWDNCIFKQNSPKASYARGLFTGDNQFHNPYGTTNDPYDAKIIGRYYINKVLSKTQGTNH